MWQSALKQMDFSINKLGWLVGKTNFARFSGKTKITKLLYTEDTSCSCSCLCCGKGMSLWNNVLCCLAIKLHYWFQTYRSLNWWIANRLIFLTSDEAVYVVHTTTTKDFEDLEKLVYFLVTNVSRLDRILVGFCIGREWINLNPSLEGEVYFLITVFARWSLTSPLGNQPPAR